MTVSHVPQTMHTLFPSESVRSLTLLMEHSSVKLQMSSKLVELEYSPPKSDLLKANLVNLSVAVTHSTNSAVLAEFRSSLETGLSTTLD